MTLPFESKTAVMRLQQPGCFGMVPTLWFLNLSPEICTGYLCKNEMTWPLKHAPITVSGLRKRAYSPKSENQL